jgi:hypothetical protein
MNVTIKPFFSMAKARNIPTILNYDINETFYILLVSFGTEIAEQGIRTSFFRLSFKNRQEQVI